MEDLFGDQVTTLNGRLVERAQPFTVAEAEAIVDEVIHGGELVQQLAESLKRLRKLMQSEEHFVMNAARRDAWEDFMWVYDLYESPAHLPFDTACDVLGMEADDVRGAISSEFGDELRRLLATISSRFPDQRSRLRTRLSPFVTLDVH